jgi:exopolyphosphatase / guanosine-5'-triphosphate,3'-diphosphate pyrophosphatase
MMPSAVRSACIDIGSNTTRLLVAEPDGPGLHEVLARRMFVPLVDGDGGAIDAETVTVLASVVAAHAAVARECGAERIHAVATAAIRHAPNRDALCRAIQREAGLPVRILDDAEEARLAFAGATRTLAAPPDGTVGVVDVGGGSSEVILGSVDDGVREVRSFKIGSGALADEFLTNDPPSPSEIRALRDRISDFFEKVEIDNPKQAVAVGGSATSLRTLVGAVLEYETLERAVRVLSSDPITDVARRFELDARRVKILPAGVLLLEKFSELLGQPLQIGKGGLREGIILDLLNNGASDGASHALAA